MVMKFVNVIARHNFLPVPTPMLHQGIRNRKRMFSVQIFINFGLLVIENDGTLFSLLLFFTLVFVVIVVIVVQDKLYKKGNEGCRRINVESIFSISKNYYFVLSVEPKTANILTNTDHIGCLILVI